jgi:hypothetical protein
MFMPNSSYLSLGNSLTTIVGGIMFRWRLLRQLYRGRDALLEGQGLVEYALILMFVAMAVIVILFFLGPAIGNVFSNIIVGL